MYVLQLEQGRFCKFCQLRIVFSQVKDRFCKYYKLSTIILQVLEVEICIFASISSWDLRLCATTTLQWTPEAETRLGGHVLSFHTGYGTLHRQFWFQIREDVYRFAFQNWTDVYEFAFKIWNCFYSVFFVHKTISSSTVVFYLKSAAHLEFFSSTILNVGYCFFSSSSACQMQ